MERNFWQNLAHPIVGLSPMDGITDFPFREVCKKYGNPDVMYTEFTSVEGVCHGASKLLDDFLYSEMQRPIVAQVFGKTPTAFRQTAVVVAELGFDGIDINMGCPAKNVAHSGAGASLIKTPKLAQEIIAATKAGVNDWLNGMTTVDCVDISPEIVSVVKARHELLPAAFQQRRTLPVSVKTRIGYDTIVTSDWINTLLEMEPALIAIHGRLLIQHHSGIVNWEEISKAAQLIHKTTTLVLGNGDIASAVEAEEKMNSYGVDGVLIGRAAMGNPFVFRKEGKQNQQADNLPGKSIYEIALEHAQLYEETFSKQPRYNFLPMRKHLGWYIHDIPDAAEIRQAVYRLDSSAEFVELAKKYQLL